MRIIAVVPGLVLACAFPAQGGIYSTTEPDEAVVSPDYRIFAQSYGSLRNIDGPPLKDTEPAPRPLDKRYRLIKALLTGKESQTGLTIEDRLNLGAALIRLRKFQDAIQVMKPAERKDPGNFLLLSNLATAYHLGGQGRLALDYMNQSLSAWPTAWSQLNKERQDFLKEMGWNEAKFAWYRKAETFYRKLLRLRLPEFLKPPGEEAVGPETLDNLFDDGETPPKPVRFVGESGKYEAGTIAKAEGKKLPKDAVLIVQQLLLWMASAQPEDIRLNWLLAELYNARGDPKLGDVKLANDILGGLYNKLLFGPGVSRKRYAELLEHLKTIQAHPDARTGPTGAGTTSNDPPSTPLPKDQPTGWAPSPWQMLGVGFLAGLLVGLLGYGQVRQWRRRQHRALAPRP
jgi:hypothetical protein